MGSGFRRSDEYIATGPIDAFDTGSEPSWEAVRIPRLKLGETGSGAVFVLLAGTATDAAGPFN